MSENATLAIEWPVYHEEVRFICCKGAMTDAFLGQGNCTWQAGTRK